MNKSHAYPAQVFWSEDDKGFVALAPDLPGCSAFGESQTEALRELQDAIEAWLEATKAAGHPIPEPSRSTVDQAHSGRVLVRMPRTLHSQLAHRAKQEGVSLNQYIVHVLSTSIGTVLTRHIGEVPDHLSNIIVDAAEVNPRSNPGRQAKKKSPARQSQKDEAG